MQPGLLIRDSRDGDLPSIMAIYAHAVSKAAGTFEIDPPDQAEMAKRREKILAQGLPYLVAEREGKIVGYSYAGFYHQRIGYRFTLEDTVYVDEACRGRGIGRELLKSLIARCDPLGYRLMVAIIGDSKNTASIAIHEKCGFALVGTLHNCGWKFDRWLDIVLMERPLGAGAATPPVEIIKK
jgi:phosphinothricin acetyltransferase